MERLSKDVFTKLSDHPYLCSINNCSGNKEERGLDPDGQFEKQIPGGVSGCPRGEEVECIWGGRPKERFFGFYREGSGGVGDVPGRCRQSETPSMTVGSSVCFSSLPPPPPLSPPSSSTIRRHPLKCLDLLFPSAFSSTLSSINHQSNAALGQH